MPIIDLSGTSGWQSKSGDKMAALQNGDYAYKQIELTEGKAQYDWMKKDNILHIEKGIVQLLTNGEELIYEKGEIIYFNADNTNDSLLANEGPVILGLFIPNK